MLRPHSVVGMCYAASMVLGAGVVSGQDYPHKPIRIVTSAPGGSPDVVARLIAQGLIDSLGQQLVVDNRGSGIIPGQIVAKASPDGYTLLVAGSAHWLSPFMQKVPFDPVRDFVPVTLATTSPLIVAVPASLPVKSVKELIALAKAKPGELNFSAGGTGGPSHLGGELFKAMAGVNIVRIPFKGGGPAVSALISGEVQVMFSSASAVMPHIKSGRLRALAVTSAQPSALAPGLPTVAASGLPGYELETTYGIFAPAKTPRAIIVRLNQEIVRVLNRADVKEKFISVGVETVGSSPEQFTADIKSEMARMGKVIKDAGIRAE